MLCIFSIILVENSAYLWGVILSGYCDYWSLTISVVSCPLATEYLHSACFKTSRTTIPVWKPLSLEMYLWIKLQVKGFLLWHMPGTSSNQKAGEQNKIMSQYKIMLKSRRNAVSLSIKPLVAKYCIKGTCFLRNAFLFFSQSRAYFIIFFLLKYMLSIRHPSITRRVSLINQ